ncbi:MAG: hypothetical protein AB8D52_02305 [Gammaproteobacteria bacterium]
MSLKIKTKDFLETEEGLIFAVVSATLENEQCLSFLRYVRSKTSSKWQKLDTTQANSHLKKYYPSYLYHSSVLDADLHAVPITKIKKHHRATKKMSDLVSSEVADNPLQVKLIQLVSLLVENGAELDSLGVTGSFLIGAENEKSDIDLVVYDRDAFHRTRDIFKNLIQQNDLSALDQKFWEEAYQRRSPSLAFDEYVWHEKRKYNKAVFENIKFDLSLVTDDQKQDHSNKPYKKMGDVKIIAEVLDDKYAYDTPSSYSLNHPKYQSLISFTPTYTGQAFIGETVEISGLIEGSEDSNDRRIIIGSSREAPGEYIKVVRSKN